MSKNKKIGPVGDGPTITKEQWFGLAIFTAMLSVLLFGWIAFQVLFGFGLESDKAFNVARSGAALLTFGGAATTFFIVFYRSKITEQQVAEARRQNDSRDKADQAILLEKAAGFLAADDLETRSAGLAMLETIIDTPKSPYGQFALDLATVKLLPSCRMEGDSLALVVRQIQRIWDRGYDNGLRQQEFKDFEFPAINSVRNPRLTISRGLPSGHYKNANFRVDGDAADIINQRNLLFYRCGFSFHPSGRREPNKSIKISSQFLSCNFSGISIESVDCPQDFRIHGPLQPHHFRNCSFTGAVISNLEIFRDSIFVDCFYFIGHAPTPGPNIEPHEARQIEECIGKYLSPRSKVLPYFKIVQ